MQNLNKMIEKNEFNVSSFLLHKELSRTLNVLESKLCEMIPESQGARQKSSVTMKHMTKETAETVGIKLPSKWCVCL